MVVSLLKRQARKIKECDQGVAFIEFALCIPFLIILFFGAVEVARYFLAIQKVEKTVDLVTDTITQADMSNPLDALTTPYVNSLFSTVSDMMDPYEVNPPGQPSRGIVIVSDIVQGADISQPPTIQWQACGGGTLNHPSFVGTTVGAPANLPDFPMTANEEVVVGEIYYNFSPILLQDIIGDIPMTRVVYFSPRMGSLKIFPSTCP